MKIKWAICLIGLPAVILFSCSPSDSKKDQSNNNQRKEVKAKDILGNPDYPAISYGGFRKKTLEEVPTVEELKEDMKILFAMGVRIIRTYKTQKTPQVVRLLQAIRQLREEDSDFEMYVMMGIWIDCKGAFTEHPDHSKEDVKENEAEIEEAIRLTNEYPEIVKVLAVGNEAMVKWAATYFVQPGVILKWVRHLIDLRQKAELPEDVWITSSDNFASWGGGGPEYHVKDLNELIRTVDYLSIHTYPMHDTHYNPSFWGMLPSEDSLSKKAKVKKAMIRATEYAKSQYNQVRKYMEGLGVRKPIHIGETGWASFSNDFYGPDGSKAIDEYKQALYYEMMREWTEKNKISCFYFEAFDEPWKDAANPGGSENHFGLFTVDGNAKYAMWSLVDEGTFNGLTRNGNPITKTYDGMEDELMKDVLIPDYLPDSTLIESK
jgi:exo-beta-1,3-glucanase (GH17 family)